MAQTYRRRHNLMTNTLGATLATGATSITFGAALQEGGSNIATLGTDEYLELTILSEVVYVTAYTAGATTATIVRAREGTVDPGTTYAAGTVVTHAPSRADWPTAKGGQIVGSGTNQTLEKAVGTDGYVWTADSASAGGVKWAAAAGGATPTFSLLRITSGDYATGSVGFGWREPFGSASDITIAATAGDLIEVSVSAQWASANSTDYMDVVAVTSYQHLGDGSTAGIASTTGRGMSGWAVETSDGPLTGVGGSVFYAAQSGDLSGGNIALRLITRTSAGRTLRASSITPLLFHVVNHKH